MILKDNIKFEECIKIATEAKALRDEAESLLKQAEPIEKKAVESFRQVREEILTALKQEKEKLEGEVKAIKTEYSELASTFCMQNRRHAFAHLNVTRESVSFLSNFLHRTCLVCGCIDVPYFAQRGIYLEGSEEIIQEAAEQTENLELKKTAQRILEIPKELESLSEKMNENRKAFEEICVLFGHDVEGFFRVRPNDPRYYCKCKCCGKVIGEFNYVQAHREAKYRGGIVPLYNYDNNTTIL